MPLLRPVIQCRFGVQTWAWQRDSSAWTGTGLTEVLHRRATALHLAGGAALDHVELFLRAYDYHLVARGDDGAWRRVRYEVTIRLPERQNVAAAALRPRLLDRHADLGSTTTSSRENSTPPLTRVSRNGHPSMTT